MTNASPCCHRLLATLRASVAHLQCRHSRDHDRLDGTRGGTQAQLRQSSGRGNQGKAPASSRQSAGQTTIQSPQPVQHLSFSSGSSIIVSSPIKPMTTSGNKSRAGGSKT